MTSISVIRLHKLGIIARHPSLLRFLRHRVVPSVEHDHLTRFEVAHVIDVGASRGQFSAWATVRLNGPAIDAFEPLPGSTQRFRELGFGPDTRLHDVAVSDFEGSREFHVTKQDDSSSLLRSTTQHRGLFPGSVIERTISVPVTTLDAVLDPAAIRRPSLLKIDVQGTELEVLAGARSLLEVTDLVYVECSFVELYVGQALASEVIDDLGTCGFDLIGTHGPHFDRRGTCVQADLLFRRRVVP